MSKIKITNNRNNTKPVNSTVSSTKSYNIIRARHFGMTSSFDSSISVRLTIRRTAVLQIRKIKNSGKWDVLNVIYL